MNWTDERVEALKRLWADGLSASQIAAELGGISRNAVIGKVHRLGLSGRVKAPSAAAPARPRKARAPSHPLNTATYAVQGNAALARARAPEPIAEPAAVVAPTPELVTFECERVTIMELREGMCRWPIGDPAREDFRFCGLRTETGHTYCSHHNTIAYQPSFDRRNRRSIAS